MMKEFPAAGASTSGYLALPSSEAAPGVLVLHAWWGLNDVFKDVCDKLAAAGFAALAPDLYGGRIAATIAEAEQLAETLSGAQARSVLAEAVAWLRAQPVVEGRPIGLVGFSMGSLFALQLSAMLPDDVAAVVAFYGAAPDTDYAGARA